MTRTITMTKDRLGEVLDQLSSLIDKHVLVGIPDSRAARTDGAAMTNAAIGYVMEFGSPAQNIPARPFLIPGVQKAEPKVLPHLKAAINAALDNNPQKITAELHACGEIAVASVKHRISSNIPPPLSPSTIRSRKYARGTSSRRAAETEYSKLIASGMPAGEAQSAAGIKSLINSGQLLRSVTYVVRDDHRHTTHSRGADLPDRADLTQSDCRTAGFAGPQSSGEIAGTAEGAAGATESAVVGAVEGIGAIIP